MSDPIPAALRGALERYRIAEGNVSVLPQSHPIYRYGADCMAAALRWAKTQTTWAAPGFWDTLAALEQESEQ